MSAVGAGALRTRAAPIGLGLLLITALVAFESLSALPSAFAALDRCRAGLRRVDEVLAAPDYDTEDAPEAVSRIREAVRDADALFFVTPEYNSSIPGALKNALDWISRPLATNALRYKPVAVIGASSGMFGAVWAQAELRKVLGAIGARVTEGEVAVGNAGERFDEHGRLNEPNLEQEVRQVVATLVADAQSAKTSQPAANAVTS